MNLGPTLILLFYILVVLFFFNQFSNYLFDINGANLFTAVWKSGKVSWGITIASILFLIGFAVIAQMNTVKVYAIHFAKQKQYVELGKDTFNYEFYYDLYDPKKKVVKTQGNELNQTAWFFDTFQDLYAKKVLKYGKNNNQVYSLASVYPKFMALGFIFEIFFLGVVLLLAFTILGAYLETTVNDLSAVQGESTLATALKWIRNEHPGFLNKMMLSIGVLYTIWLLLAIPAGKKLLASAEKPFIVEKLPAYIKEGKTITGIFEDYNKHSNSLSSNTDRKPGSTDSIDQNWHINVLVRFDSIYQTPIYLRFSLKDLAKNWEWLEEWKNQKGEPMTFKIIEEQGIWPADLKEDPENIG